LLAVGGGESVSDAALVSSGAESSSSSSDGSSSSQESATFSGFLDFVLFAGRSDIDSLEMLSSSVSCVDGAIFLQCSVTFQALGNGVLPDYAFMKIMQDEISSSVYRFEAVKLESFEPMHY
jgi:hypothetical protein